MQDERLQRRHRHLVADLFDRLGWVVRVPFLGLVARRVVELAAAELLQPFHDRVVVPCHAHRRGGLHRIHHPDHVRWSELRLHEAGKLVGRLHAALDPHMVVVEEEREQADIVARRF